MTEVGANTGTDAPRTRRAVVDDAAGIAAVHGAAWQVAYRGFLPDAHLDDLSSPEQVRTRTDRWRRSLEQGRSMVVVEENAGGRISGFAAFGPTRDDDADELTGEVYAIYLDPALWGTGRGRAVHDAALAELSASGSTSATLWVLDANARARSFYERQGWTVDDTPAGVKQDEAAGTTITEVRYRRPLP